MSNNPFPFPLHVASIEQHTVSMPQISGARIDSRSVTVHVYAEGNSVTEVKNYSITLYDSAGRLDAYNHGYDRAGSIIDEMI
jgi:hypothetical protein